MKKYIYLHVCVYIFFQPVKNILHCLKYSSEAMHVCTAASPHSLTSKPQSSWLCTFSCHGSVPQECCKNKRCVCLGLLL